MNREKCGDKSALPVRAGLALTGDVAQPKEKQNRGNGVQENICEMVAAGFEIVELAIDHVGNDRERVPIVGLGVDECLGQTMQTQTRGHQRISVNVGFVVIIYEVVAQRLTEDDPD